MVKKYTGGRSVLAQATRVVQVNTGYPGDANALGNSIDVLSVQYGYNGSSFDRWRNNAPITIFSATARTASENSADLINFNARGFYGHVDVTAVSGTNPTMNLALQGKEDEVTDNYLQIRAFTEITTTTTIDFLFYPTPATSGQYTQTANNVIPRIWRIAFTIGGTDTPTFTFSMAGNYQL